MTAPDHPSVPEAMSYRIAGRTITVEALDPLSREVVTELFADWYLLSQDSNTTESSSSIIRIRSTETPPTIPEDFDGFEIAGEGLCYAQGTVSYIDIHGSRIAIGVPGMADVEIWLSGITAKRSPEATRLISYALSSALRRCGLFELHSAAVVEPESGRGVLIIGASGSGKSTLTVQLSAAGWSYLSDDVLMLNGAGADIEAWSLRRCFSVTAETVAMSRLLHSSAALLSADSFNESKQRFSPQGVFGSAFRENCTPLTLIFTEVVVGVPSRLLRLSAADAMARLIRMSPWSCYDTKTASEHLALFGRLVKQTESFALSAGKDLLEPEFASRFIGEYVRN
jgi:hypothetical protein